ncbi:transaldolase family protein [Streptomyces sp. NPDC056231]|uniref:transaldolase family protein n=1 Tax=Streptomyces sp. NPDC056231 TaxID=3345755 RepID=UPI003AACC2BF
MVSDTLARLSAPGVSIWLDDWRVTIGVDPRLAHDTARTVAEARALWWLVDQPNLFVKMPAVKQGLGAIGGCLAEGLSINVTLLFSLDRYDAVAEAFLIGMERAQDAGRDLSRIAWVASFFVSRVDTEIDRRLDRLGCVRPAALHGRAAIANALIAYEHYADVVQVLEDEGVERFDASWNELVEKLAVSPHESASGRPHGTDRSGEKV